MRRIIHIFAFVLLPQPAGPFSTTAAADEPLPTRFEPAKPPQPDRDSTGLSYQGTVTGVTKDSITIRWPGEKEPKKFSVSEILASGKFPTKKRARLDGLPPHTVLPAFRYRLTDVKVDDQVYITFAYLGGVDICDEIRISKRPGGQVPPLPEGAENLKRPDWLPEDWVVLSLIPYHERMNALWDLEDKGIPYPEKFGPYRRFPVAPMPREVKPGPSIAP